MPQPPKPDNEPNNGADDAPQGESPAHAGLSYSVPWLARVCGLVQGFSGVVAAWALSLFFQTPDNDDLRYQYLLIPILVWMVSVTILFASVMVILRSSQRLNWFDWIWFGLGALIPTIVMTAVLFTPLIG